MLSNPSLPVELMHLTHFACGMMHEWASEQRRKQRDHDQKALAAKRAAAQRQARIS